MIIFIQSVDSISIEITGADLGGGSGGCNPPPQTILSSPSHLYTIAGTVVSRVQYWISLHS